MKWLAPLVLLLVTYPVTAQVYRWVDQKGTVHYSNTTPPAGVKATVISDLEAKSGPASPESADCYTVRCQGERLEQRLARREELERRLAAERAAAPRPPRGLSFRDYMFLRQGMTEGELVTRAGAPDLMYSDALSFKTYTYLPTPSDPFTTTVMLLHGRVTEIERVRKF